MIFLLAAALYVGNHACERCHAEIARSYAATPMAQSSGRARDGITPGSFKHAPSGVSYAIESSGAVHLSKGELREERQLDYFVGSGAAGRTYLSSSHLPQQDGFVFQAPMTWYRQTGRWDASPGYQGDTLSRWSRPIEPSCLFCHASQVRMAPETQNRYADPPFAQSGVGCERCHGPGSEHIAGGGRMVNPSKLAPVRRDAVCSQCHMSGEARIARVARTLSNYRPGELLSDYAAFFVRAESTGLKATGYVERLAESGCKRGAGDRLACVTCHDPHRVIPAPKRAAWYRGKCLTCHAGSDCRRGEDCAGCHMPKARVMDVSHAALTDHSISRTTGNRGVSSTGDWRLRPFSPADEGDRELGLAYAEAYAVSGDVRQRAEAKRLLSAALPDAEVDVALARLLQGEGDGLRAGSLYQEALREKPGLLLALVNLGTLYGSAGRLGDAVTLWRAALQRNPCQGEAGANLVKALEALGRSAEAKGVREMQHACSFP